MSYGSGKRNRRRRRGGRFVTVALVLMCLAVLAGLSVFFRVAEIEIVGLAKYDEDEVAAKSGVEPGDNLLLLRESDIAISIRKNFPYVEDVRIRRELPDKLVVTVTESAPAAYVAVGGAYWKVDAGCRLLERTDIESVAGLTELRGIEPVSPSEGQPISLGADGESKLVYIKSVLSAIVTAGMSESTGWLDVENISRISFSYTDGLTVTVGSGADVDVKFRMIRLVLDDLKEGERGVIDVSDISEAHFIPE